ncbi:GDP-mannose 4,6-dehydratase, partial [Candidatus Pelagibacter sp.]|nr:GDP-mannose 4,6-dehydratase [Candidatus Pelagibacter sp.]
IHGDISNYDSVAEAFKGINIVFNLAALISVPYSFKNPESFIQTNVDGLINVLRASGENKKNIKRIIQISSSEVYGNTINSKIKILTENLKLKSESPYAASKIAADHLATTSFKSHQTPIVVARPFNTFGPRQSLRAVIPTVISQFINTNNKKIMIGNLNSSRDFVYIKDTVDGLIKLMDAKNVLGEVINISSNNSYSVKDIIEILSKYTKSKPQIIVQQKRKRVSELNKLRGSNKKIYKLTKWRPKYATKANFSKALIETYKWFSEPKNFKNYQNLKKYHI